MYNLQNLPSHTYDALDARMERYNSARRASMDIADINSASHSIGIVDECYRCTRCEIGAWNAHKSPCPVS